MPLFVCINGRFVPLEEAKVSVMDHGFLYGDGIYDTLRTFGGKLFRVEKHLDRLYAALEVVKIPVPWDKNEVMTWIREGIERNGLKEARVRITVTRGNNSFHVSDVKGATLVILFSPIAGFDEDISKGVEVVTYEIERALKEVKTISMAPVMMARAEMEKTQTFEVLLVNREGFVTEGSVMNVFMVEEGEVLTPGEGMLEGTTREVVLEWLVGKYPVRIENITREDLLAADEVFLTNAVKGVVPVIMIDGEMVGDGMPGKVTEELIEKFRVFVE